VTSDFDAQTAVERELVLRLASLLWRLRRALAVETGLLQIQGDVLREVRQAGGSRSPGQDRHCGDATPQVHDQLEWSNVQDDEATSEYNGHEDTQSIVSPPHEYNADIARCFLRLANLDNGAFERLSRYEATLWRQVGQILFTLDLLRPAERGGNRHHRARYINSKRFSFSNESVASPRLHQG